MECIKDFFKEDWSKAEKVLLVSTCVLGGILLGILFSPKRKKNVRMGCNNGNNNRGGLPCPEDEK